jgi:phosphatidyl-myo-inositol alpha-mannosyltransferase
MFRGGGVQECVKALQEEYVKRGHYSKIITPLPRDYKGEIPESIITLGVSMNTKAFAGTAWQWSVSVDTDAIDDVFEHEQFDVLHFHEPWIPVWSRQLVLRSKAAHVATMHGRFFDTMTAKTITSVITPYTKPMIKHFDVFTAVSETATEYFRTLSNQPVTIVPNAIDLDKYRAAPASAIRNPKTKTILYIGRLENRKGLKYLLRAFSLLAEKRKDVQLLIAGTGPDESKLRQFIKENAIPRVTFLGFISDKDKIHHLHRASLFCSPAHYGESFGIVLLEAMAAGCPVVAGDNVGYQSVMKETGALSLVNPLDTVDFARRLELMLFDESLRKIWLKWAKPYVSGFNYGSISRQYEEVYKQAIEHHEKRARPKNRFGF